MGIRKQHRREFLKYLSIIGATAYLNGAFPVRAGGMHLSDINYLDNDQILVFIYLGGGNDGLNTLIPVHQYEVYKEKRPELHLKKSDIHYLSKYLALNKKLDFFQKRWDEGNLQIIRNVGYPNPNLSHFQSFDTWHSAMKDNSGWLGRWLEVQYKHEQKTLSSPPVTHISGESGLLFQGNKRSYHAAISDMEDLTELTRAPLEYVISGKEDGYNKVLDFLKQTTNSTFSYANAIQKAIDNGKNDVAYEDGSILAEHLSMVAKLIKGRLRSKVYYCALDGFDTHINQKWEHDHLLEILDKNLAAFYADLKKREMDKQVVCFIYSEFGRRIEENASGGTDHGTAGPVFLIGDQVHGGTTGRAVDLVRPDLNGNLQYDIDFRSIYASIMKEMLGASSSMVHQVLGNVPALENLFM